ncbi:MAG TPA: zinc-dependent metalloprotease [Acidimicrobiales bacterium]|nr:zinc-dependent metalloprotease [Acidimicrobiales bacterium]
MSGPGPNEPFEGIPGFGDIAKMFASSGPVNWDIAKQMARYVSTEGVAESNVDPLQRVRFEELLRVADLNIADATGLPTSASGKPLTVRTVGRGEWALTTLDAYRHVLEALAAALGETPAAPADTTDESPPDPLGQLLGGFTKFAGPMLFGMQAGVMVGHLSHRALGQYDVPLPRPASDELVVVAANVDAFAADWSLPADDVRLWVCLAEVANHAVLSRPHVRARIDALVHDYVTGFQPDPSFLESRLAEIDPTDPAAIQEALGDPEVLLGAMQTPGQASTLAQLDAVVSAVAGYVDHVVDTTGRRLIGSFAPLGEALRRRRVQTGKGDRFVGRLLGLELGQAQFDRGARFVEGVVERAGPDGLLRLWHSERELPTPAELDAPGLWLERIDLPT